MGSSSKKYKEKETRKRRHHSPPHSEEHEPKEKRHRHRRHHRDKKRDKRPDYESDDSDVIEVIPDEAPAHGAGGSSDSLSIDETNKLRAKLGLKPLDVASDKNEKKAADGKKKDDWGEFYHKPAENWADKAEREKIREKLAASKEKRQIQQKLNKVKTLGESDSEDDAGNWIDRSRKIENAKRQAQKRAKMLEEMDEQFGVSEFVENEKKEVRKQKYTEKHLKGLRVEHDLETFAEERDVVLTLKDKGVLDEDDEDVLVNVNMIDDEKYKKNVEHKKKKILYNAYEDQEYDEFGNPKEKSLLAQYDETIDGAKRESFKIGYDNTAERKQIAAQSIKEKLAAKHLETIESKDLKLASEYYNEEELSKFKKPKKKVRKIRTKGKLTADDLEKQIDNTGIEEVGSRRPKLKPELDTDDTPDIDVDFNDIKIEDDKDEILEQALHKTRRMKQKENLVADLIKTSVKDEPEEAVDNSNITLNATAEFCRTLGDIPTYGKSGNREETEDLMDFERDVKDDVEMEQEEEDEEKSGWNSVDPNESRHVPHVAPQEVQILDEEPDVSTGVGAALKLAMSKGYLDKEQNKRPSNSRLAHLQAKHYSIEDKTYGDDTERGSNRRERYTGPISEFKEKDGFKPNVKLEYIDDDGHVLNSKEAFRYLSHKFHGKGPGKNKIEKRLKKSIQEQLMKKMSSTDTPLGTLNMLQAKQKETQSPFIVLSGNKVNQAAVISKTRR